MSAEPGISAIARDARWLAHRYDPSHDAIHLRWVDRDRHRSTTFLTDELLGAVEQPLILRRPDLLAADPPRAPIHFIFHSAYCCSTLLARALDRPGVAAALKEPVILNDLIGWRGREPDAPGFGSALESVLRLLERPFAPGEAVVVKPSNVVNGLAASLLERRPDARAVLLFAPLERFLASIARKGMDGRLWVRGLFVRLRRDGLIRLPFSNQELFEQTDLQIAATGWLAQHAEFARMASALGPKRVRTLDSETLVARPAECLRATAALFGLDAAGWDEVAAGPVFARHSKLDSDYSADARSTEHRAGVAVHAEEIAKVAAWTRAVAESAGLDLTLPSPLLD